MSKVFKAVTLMTDRHFLSHSFIFLISCSSYFIKKNYLLCPYMQENLLKYIGKLY